MNMKWTMIIILGLGLAPLYAEGPPSATTPPDSPAAQTPKPKPSKVSELAGRYNVPEKDVSDLRDKGMAYRPEDQVQRGYFSQTRLDILNPTR